MNKKLLPIILFPLVLSIASCGGNEGSKGTSSDSVSEKTDVSSSEMTSDSSSEKTSDPSSSAATIPNQEDVDNLKSLLAKQDLSPFNEKAYFSQYQQNFTVYTNHMDDDGKSIDFYNYRGSGNFGYYYNVDKEVYEETIKKEGLNTFDIMCQGLGYYGLIQYATINSFLNDEYEEREDNERFTYIQQLQALFDDTNLQIDNMYLFSDFNDDENMDYRLFNGIIDKETLFGAYTTAALSNVFSRVNIYDGPGYCETIDELYYQICLTLSESSDKEISDFILNNEVAYAESDKYSELSFALKEDKYIEQLIDNDVLPGTIKGTLYLDKETKELDSFEYRIIHFEEEADHNENFIRTASMDFKVEGYSRHGKHEDDPSLSEEPVVYTDAHEFMDQVIAQVLPNIAN